VDLVFTQDDVGLGYLKVYKLSKSRSPVIKNAEEKHNSATLLIISGSTHSKIHKTSKSIISISMERLIRSISIPMIITFTIAAVSRCAFQNKVNAAVTV